MSDLYKDKMLNNKASRLYYGIIDCVRFDIGDWINI